MGWSITEFENNTLKLTKKIAKQLWKATSTEYEGHTYNDDFRSEKSVIDQDGFLVFDTDAQEHMDYLSNNDDIIKVLQDNKVKGRVLFCSHEGDNAGEYWGHEFDGEGGYKPLKGVPGSIEWIAYDSGNDEDESEDE